MINNKLEIILNMYYQPHPMLKAYLQANKALYKMVNAGSLRGTKDSWINANIIQEDRSIDNISKLNPLLNELTAIYWYWKNATLPDYVGHNHYRRLFNSGDLLDMLEYDMIVQQPIPMRFLVKKPEVEVPKTKEDYDIVNGSIEDGYKICHDPVAWDKFREELLKTDIGQRYFSEWKKLPYLYSPCQMFVMKKELFREYCQFIYPILFALKDKIDMKNYDNYQKRQLAFIGERLLSIFAYSKKQEGFRIKEIGTMYFESFKPETSTDNRGDFS